MMDIVLIERPEKLAKLESFLKTVPRRMIACSGGIDSLLLATVAHRQSPEATTIAHAVSPAVPAEATCRVHNRAKHEGWNLVIVESGEFDSEDYLSNPVNRCYYCKTNLYETLTLVSLHTADDETLMSGANTDDLGEYRPGLVAAEENAVRHPYVECHIDKQTIRAIARHLKLPFAELPASPCLASRLYTGTRVTSGRLSAVEKSEELIRHMTGIQVIRCRIQNDSMLIEVGDPDRHRITTELLSQVFAEATTHEPGLENIVLDPKPYYPGRAFVAGA